jgi:hypothetical protein
MEIERNLQSSHYNDIQHITNNTLFLKELEAHQKEAELFSSSRIIPFSTPLFFLRFQISL